MTSRFRGQSRLFQIVDFVILEYYVSFSFCFLNQFCRFLCISNDSIAYAIDRFSLRRSRKPVPSTSDYSRTRLLLVLLMVAATPTTPQRSQQSEATTAKPGFGKISQDFVGFRMISYKCQVSVGDRKSLWECSGCTRLVEKYSWIQRSLLLGMCRTLSETLDDH